MLQLQECKSKIQDLKEENVALMAYLSEVEYNMENTLDLNAKLQDNLEYFVGAHDFLSRETIRLENELEKARHIKIDL